MLTLKATWMLATALTLVSYVFQKWKSYTALFHAWSRNSAFSLWDECTRMKVYIFFFSDESLYGIQGITLKLMCSMVVHNMRTGLWPELEHCPASKSALCQVFKYLVGILNRENLVLWNLQLKWRRKETDLYNLYTLKDI